MNTVRSSFATASRALALALALPTSIVACAGTEASDATPTYRLTYAVGADGARSDTPQTIEQLRGVDVTTSFRPIRVRPQDPPLGCVCSPPVEDDPTCTCNGEINCCNDCCGGTR
jgi:hypothetical protein